MASNVGRGFVMNDKERWNYANSQLECVEGHAKVTYSWDGSNFRLLDESVCHGGYGHYANNTWKWFFPLESRETPFWQFEKKGDQFVCTSIQYKSPLTWELSRANVADDNRRVKRVEGGNDHPRGHAGDEWEIGGSVPTELAFFGVMFSRTQVLMDTLIERRRRNYLRCDAFTPTDQVKPMMCINCAQGEKCICCDSRHGGYSGRFCKSCAPRRNFCAKCGDGLGQGPKAEGFLCDRHGYANLANNCCRMKF